MATHAVRYKGTTSIHTLANNYSIQSGPDKMVMAQVNEPDLPNRYPLFAPKGQPLNSQFNVNVYDFGIAFHKALTETATDEALLELAELHGLEVYDQELYVQVLPILRDLEEQAAAALPPPAPEPETP